MPKKGFTLIELLIVVAIIAILAAIAVPNFLEAQVRSKVSRVKADQRSLATALESYYIDNNSYPATDSSNWGTTEGFVINGFPTASPGAKAIPTFRTKQNNTDQLATITTPIAYITSIFTDPFAKTKGASFAYSTPQANLGPEVSNAGWITWSYGPDTDEPQGPGDVPFTTTGSPRVETVFYNPRDRTPSEQLLIFATYDPTNGTTSNGDVWRLKQ